MTSRNSARPALAGALCIAFTSAGAQSAPAQTDTAAPALDPTVADVQDARIHVRHRALHVRAGRRAAVAGRVAPGVAGLRVALQVRRDGRWKPIDRARTRIAGRYVLRARPQHAVSRPVRVRVFAAPGLRPARRPVGRLNVYRVAHASWYGPGLYGNRTGCGGTLIPGRLGVAHKTLPCGTQVTLRHRGRSVRVPVIDRGPYVGGREYDLTQATAQRLGFAGHGAIMTTR